MNFPSHISAEAAPSDDELVSAWVDGELDAEESARLYSSMRGTEGLTVSWTAFHVVGDALRSNEVGALHSSDLQEKIRMALKSEPSMLMPIKSSQAQVWRRWAGPLAGLSATVALIALGTFKGLAPDPSGRISKSADLAASAKIISPNLSSLPSNVAASDPLASSELQRDPRIEAYLRAHREMDVAGVVPRAVRFLRAEDTR